MMRLILKIWLWFGLFVFLSTAVMHDARTAVEMVVVWTAFIAVTIVAMNLTKKSLDKQVRM